MIKFHDRRAEIEAEIEASKAELLAELRTDALPKNPQDWDNETILRVLNSHGGIEFMLSDPEFKKTLATLASKKRKSHLEDFYFGKMVYWIDHNGFDVKDVVEMLSVHMAMDLEYSPDYLRTLWYKTIKDKKEKREYWQNKWKRIDKSLGLVKPEVDEPLPDILAAMKAVAEEE